MVLLFSFENYFIDHICFSLKLRIIIALVLGEAQTQKLDHTTITAESKYSNNFSRPN